MCQETEQTESPVRKKTQNIGAGDSWFRGLMEEFANKNVYVGKTMP